MPLSDHEKRLLAEMEEALAADDPRLISAFSGKTPSWIPSNRCGHPWPLNRHDLPNTANRNYRLRNLPKWSCPCNLKPRRADEWPN